jgi:hypothetical protein
MLELSRYDLTFEFSDSSPMSTELTLRNTAPSSFISFKVGSFLTQIMTTRPELFDVNPSKGIIMPGQSKQVEFRVQNVMVGVELIVDQGAGAQHAQKGKVSGAVSDLQ